MKCYEVEQKIDAYLDRELPAPAARELETHVRECAACREEYGRLMEFLSTKAEITVPEGLADRVCRVALKSGERKRNVWIWISRVGAAAALVGLIVLGGRLMPKKESGVRMTAAEPQVAPSPWLVSSSVQSLVCSGWPNPAGVMVQTLVMDEVTRRIVEGPRLLAQVRYRPRVRIPARAEVSLPRVDWAWFSLFNRL